MRNRKYFFTTLLSPRSGPLLKAMQQAHNDAEFRLSPWIFNFTGSTCSARRVAKRAKLTKCSGSFESFHCYDFGEQENSVAQPKKSSIYLGRYTPGVFGNECVEPTTSPFLVANLLTTRLEIILAPSLDLVCLATLYSCDY